MLLLFKFEFSAFVEPKRHAPLHSENFRLTAIHLRKPTRGLKSTPIIRRFSVSLLHHKVYRLSASPATKAGTLNRNFDPQWRRRVQWSTCNLRYILFDEFCEFFMDYFWVFCEFFVDSFWAFCWLIFFEILKKMAYVCCLLALNL